MCDMLKNPEEYFNKLSDEELFDLLTEFGIEFKVLDVETNKGDKLFMRESLCL